MPPLIIHSTSQISSSATLSQQQQQQSGASTNTPTSNNTNSSSNNVNKNQSNTSTLISTTSNNVLQTGNAFNTHSKSLGQSNSLYADDKQSGTSSGRCSPPLKRIKCEPNEMVDACVGTSVGTITEPDCLGPCEPGTSVTLEGIVWHETEGGKFKLIFMRGKIALMQFSKWHR